MKRALEGSVCAVWSGSRCFLHGVGLTVHHAQPPTSNPNSDCPIREALRWALSQPYPTSFTEENVQQETWRQQIVNIARERNGITLPNHQPVDTWVYILETSLFYKSKCDPTTGRFRTVFPVSRSSSIWKTISKRDNNFRDIYYPPQNLHISEDFYSIDELIHDIHLRLMIGWLTVGKSGKITNEMESGWLYKLYNQDLIDDWDRTQLKVYLLLLCSVVKTLHMTIDCQLWPGFEQGICRGCATRSAYSNIWKQLT